MSEALDARLVELETQLTFQQDTLDALNAVVTRQAALLEALEARLEQLSASVRLGGGPAADASSEPPPPHY